MERWIINGFWTTVKDSIYQKWGSLAKISHLGIDVGSPSMDSGRLQTLTSARTHQTLTPCNRLAVQEALFSLFSFTGRS
jgi:hypothetical protein